MSRIPDHPKDFEAAWLAQALGQRGETLKGFSHAPVGTGQVSDSYRLQLHWEGADAQAPSSVIAKCPASSTTSRETAHSMRLYEIETQFYRLYAPVSEARTPHTWLAELDTDSGDGLLLLEDMAPARQVDQIAGCSVAQVRLALNEAARLHSSHWDNTQLTQVPWLNYSNSEERRKFAEQLLPAVYPDWCKRYHGRIDGDILQLGQAFVERFSRYAEPQGNAPIVLAHGDLRLDNMLFTDADGRAVLLDWQTVSAAPPMRDVAYCISTSLSEPEVRAAHEAELVAHYYSQLGIAEDRYSCQQAWDDYRRASFTGFVMAVLSSMLVERTERGDEMFAVMAERSGWQALHLDALSLI